MALNRAFQIPEAAENAANLLLANQHAQNSIPPSAAVYCINRGRVPLKDMFDGVELEMPPGYFQIEYGAALHFKERLIVPGTRNLEVGGYVSWIGILGTTDGRLKVDKEEDCQPFTDEELQRYGEAIEGLDRQALSDPLARDVQVVRTSTALAASGGPRARGIDAGAQISEAAREAAAHVLEPPAENLAREAEAVAAAEGHRPVAPGVSESVQVKVPSGRGGGSGKRTR